MHINPGSFNKRVAFYKYIEKKENGFTVQDKKLVCKVWAKIKSSRAYETTVQEKINGEFVYTILVRYFNGLTTDMLIEYKGQELKITRINNVDEANYIYEISAVCKNLS